MSAPDRRRRARTSKATETEVLVGTARRCCLCYGLYGDLSVKAGQLAHVDHNPSNSAGNNLVFLCFEHHDQYDSKTSQSKGLTAEELRIYRAALKDLVRTSRTTSDLRNLPESPPPSASYRLVGDSLFIPVGHVSPYFATDGDVTCELRRVRVLIVARALRSMRELFPILEQAMQAKKPLLVVADGFDEEVLSTMVVNTQNGKLQLCAIALGEISRRETRRAIARFSQATIIGDEAGRRLDGASLKDLGTISAVRADRRSTILKKTATRKGAG